ncbi:uncharacterized protein CEXT_121201 [Caerostris extrusa]|uniref:Uncharacterized protein n=1 Tax=Caerostris extrusa TaxID=172846 RepID=A0AAV4Q787_CAEEX|nr:uncharacterized protein CEXT_121201 [Caerostris extrusa]
MKYDRSITQTDFLPPYPMLPQDKSPCLPVPPGEVPYAPKRSPPKNPHAKILEYKTVDPGLLYVEEEPKREFTTETGDSYICYQKSKKKDPLKTFTPQEKELFLERIHKTHEKCHNGFPHKFMCDDKTCESELCSAHKNILCDGGKDDAKETNVKKQDACERTPWLLYPKNYSFPNGYMILPSQCQQMQEKNI